MSYLASLVAGGLIHLSFAPYNLWLPGFSGLILFALFISLSDSPKQLFRVALAFGLGLFGAGVNWVYVSIHIYGEVPAPLAVLFTAGFVALLALIFALPWMLMAKCTCGQGQRLICFPVFWFLGEWLRGWLLTGFPWLYLGYGQVDAPLQGWIPIVGVLGAGALLATAAALVIYLLRQRNRLVTAYTLMGLLVIFGSGIGLKNQSWTKEEDASIPVTLVQPDIPLRDKWNPTKAQGVLDVLEGQSQEAWQPGLLIWPEAALPYTGPRAKSYVAFLDDMASHTGTAMITGMLTYDPEQERYLNSIVGLGNADRIYHKQRLVPFGEYVPLESWLRGLMYFFDLPMSVISAGSSGQQPLEFTYLEQTFRVAPAICYEIAYTDLVRSMAADANILVTLSNDAWFGTSIGPWQHLQIAQARALENQKPILRVTNNGITGLVSPNGKILAAIPQFKRSRLYTEITPRSGISPYTSLGNWPLIAVSLLTLICCFLIRRKRIH